MSDNNNNNNNEPNTTTNMKNENPKSQNYIVVTTRKKWRTKNYFLLHFDTSEVIDGPFPATTRRGASKLAYEQGRVPYGVPFKMCEM